MPPPPAGPTSGSNWRGLSRDEYPAGVARRIEESSEQWCQLSVTASKSKFPSRSDCVTNACLSVRERAFQAATGRPGAGGGIRDDGDDEGGRSEDDTDEVEEDGG